MMVSSGKSMATWSRWRGWPEVVGAVRGVVHGRVDAHGDVELDGLGVQRIVTPVAGGNAVHEGGDAEGLEALLAYAALQLAHAFHADEAADARQSDEAVRVVAEEGRQLVVGGAEGHRAHDPDSLEHLHEGGELGGRARVTASFRERKMRP